jgi:hypothetical protein
MHIVLVLGLAGLLVGCATMGGAAYPELADPNTIIAEAEREILEAERVGVDSAALAPARESLEAARAPNVLQGRAAAKARQAIAEARYARAAAQRAAAERELREAEQLLAELPKSGGTP